MQNKRLQLTMILLLGSALLIISIIWIGRLISDSNQEELVEEVPISFGGTPYPDVDRISPQDAKAAYDRGEAVLVDVRGQEYYDESHIAGALSIPGYEIQDHLSELSKSQWIITYCT